MVMIDPQISHTVHLDVDMPNELDAVAIVVVAYNAESTIEAVLDRIPRTVAEHVGAILVSDDGSRDGTTAAANRWAVAHPAVNLHVIRQPKNLGYGGNQKFCYEWAVRNGCEFAVMVHGDGQYAPELVLDMVRPLLAGDAVAVFGSRMLTRGGARRGGMPMYKLVGNKILTFVQNRLTGLRLSEWHSGYRAYDLRRLDGEALAAMSNGFDFDTEIILHLARTKQHIAEIAIPTFYGDEKCHVNGMRYAADVLVDVVRFRTRGPRVDVDLANAA